MTQISRILPMFGALLSAAAAIAPAYAGQAAPAAPPAPPPPGVVPKPAPTEVRVERRIVIVDENGVQSEYGPELLDDPQVRSEIRRLRGPGGPEGRMRGARGEAPPRVSMIRRAERAGELGKGRGGAAARMQRMADDLGLSPEQRKQVRDIYEAARPQMDATRSQMRVERQRLRDASPGERNHATTVATASKRIGELSAEATRQRGEMQRKVWQVLTPEQRTKADGKRAESRKRRDEQAARLESRARELRGEDPR